jgi:bla regulator protein blaR1
VKRHDLPLNWVIFVLQSLHWFNPLLWFAFARMRADRELACDARVLSIDATDRRAEYGGALLKLQCAAPAPALSLGFIGIFEKSSEIKSRIRAISAHREGRLASRVAGGALVMLLMVLGCTKGQQDSPVDADPAPAEEAAPEAAASGTGKEQIHQKLDAIIFPRVLFDDNTVGEAIDLLRLRSQELDPQEVDPGKKGINFIIKSFPADVEPGDPRLFSELEDVTIRGVLQNICDQSGMRYMVDDHAVILMPKNEDVNQLTAKPDAAGADEKATATQHKLDSIILPSIQLRHNTLDYAVDLLRRNAIELDVAESDPAKRGIRFEIREGGVAAQARIIRELELKNVPIGAVLQYICDQTDMSYHTSENGVFISPKY